MMQIEEGRWDQCRRTLATFRKQKSNPLSGLLSRPAPNHVDIVRFGPKGALTALKRVYLVKRSLYIYSARSLLPYPM